MTNLGGDQLIVVCVYARRRCVAAIASLPSRLRRCIAATLVVVGATAVAAVGCRLMDAMVKKHTHVGRWREDGR